MISDNEWKSPDQPERPLPNVIKDLTTFKSGTVADVEAWLEGMSFSALVTLIIINLHIDGWNTTARKALSKMLGIPPILWDPLREFSVQL